MKVEMNTSDLVKLTRWIHKAPQRFSAAANMWVNRAAFGTRDNVLSYMRGSMIIRNDGFLRSRMRVQKARRGDHIASNFSEMGSIRTARHTGWAEQEGLIDDKRNKTITLAARGGNKTKRVRPSLRMSKGRARPRPTDYPGRTKRQRANAMLQTLGKERHKKPFILHGHRALGAGLYRFGRGPKSKRKIIAIQLFGRRPARPKRNPWMTNSVDRYFDNINKRAVWRDIMLRVGTTKMR